MIKFIKNIIKRLIERRNKIKRIKKLKKEGVDPFKYPLY